MSQLRHDVFQPSRPLTARSVLATALLGSPDGALPVSHLLGAGALFGIADSAVRTCLSRMVANGELTTAAGVYALAGTLAERRHDVDGAVRPRHPDRRWDGTWEIAVARPGARSAAQRHELRIAAAALGLGVVRDGCWVRPNNLDPDRQPAARAVVVDRCLVFVAARIDEAHTDRGGVDCDDLFDLSGWAESARHLEVSITAEATRADDDGDDRRRRFLLAIAVARHLRADPLLPHELLPSDWPGGELRRAYEGLTTELLRAVSSVAA